MQWKITYLKIFETKIPTEEDGTTLKEIRSFLEEKGHPILERIKTSQAEVPEEELICEEEALEEGGEIEMEDVPMAPVAYAPELTVPSSGGVKIIFKNAKVYEKR
jgi:acetyl-CoA decarbonylase/synthase complex subunit beta